MIEFVVPAVLVCAGIACLLFPRQIGVSFCRIGKASWRASTFGLTDMGRFYPEDKAPAIFRILGVALILFSIPWIIMGVASATGPGAFAAIRESKTHLRERFGVAGTWRVSAQPAPTADGDYFVEYTYGTQRGRLLGVWKGDHYVFKEAQQPNQLPEPTSGSVTPRAASSAEPTEARDARVAPPPPVAHR